jgi:hypothetical protein
LEGTVTLDMVDIVKFLLLVFIGKW